MSNDKQTFDNQQSHASLAGVGARFSDLPIGAKYKYRPEHEGVFTILERDGNWATIHRHCGRVNQEINDGKIVYPV